MKPGPVVSICMPTYNRAHMVGLAIDAILSQSFPDFELIIVNDGSKDHTKVILADYAARDPRIKVINKDNEGIPDTVNRGWKEATGHFVTWTSDDNLYYPQTLERLVGYLQSHPETMLVYTDCRYIDGDGNPMYNMQCKGPDVLQYECPIMGCLLFRRSVFEHTDMFRKRWRRVHDYDFYRRIWKTFRVDHLPECLYDYRLHAASMTGDHYAMTTEHAELLDSVSESSAERRAAWGACWQEIARQAVRDNRPWKAVAYDIRAAIVQPSRTPQAWSRLWRTSYSLVPNPIQRLWRLAKSR
jgi:glycosyltransferase involved in cell wall biosynthesis